MEIFGQLERFLSEVLYPYRLPLSAAAVLALAGAGWWLWRTGQLARLLTLVRRHPARSALAGLAFLAITLPAGNYLLTPLWTRSEVVEASPLDAEAYAKASSPATAAPAAFQPRTVGRGDWKGADEFHFARGRALVVEVAPGQFVLRVEEFSIRNGPDLFVMLSPAPDGYRAGALKLGKLKATDGAFNYEIPPGTDLAAFQSVVVWCEQFATLFATAALTQNR